MILEVRTLNESPIDNQRIVRELNRSTESNSLLSRQQEELLKMMHTFQHGGHDDEIIHLQGSREEIATQWGKNI
ncbi:hypothetical protein Q1695_005425 [Nippostrongylus brasiliensis]|nr:hypothetical protein Q1695_005425 [Nippostrongylus brasiliensis]